MKKYEVFEINKEGINNYQENLMNLFEEIRPKFIQDLVSFVKPIILQYFEDKIEEGLEPSMDMAMGLIPKLTEDIAYNEDVIPSMKRYKELSLWDAYSQLMSFREGGLVPPKYEKKVEKLLDEDLDDISFAELTAIQIKVSSVINACLKNADKEVSSYYTAMTLKVQNDFAKEWCNALVAEVTPDLNKLIETVA